MNQRIASCVTSALFLLAAASASAAEPPLKIGEINSYKSNSAFLEPYKKGMEMAIEEINARGGLLGRRIELVTRDDNTNPGDALRAAEELLSREKVDVLMGTYLSNIGLAMTDFAKQKKTFFLATEPLTDKIVWEQGNRYTYRLRPSTYMQVAMLVPEAAKLHKKRWALVYPNFEYGQSAVNTFKKLLKEAQPDVEFVAEQAPPVFKIDAGSVVQAIADAKPDAIFNALHASDFAKFVREGTTRGLFTGRPVVSLLSGEPEYLDPLRDEAPQGWIATGYPWSDAKIPAHAPFLAAYRKKYGTYPRLGSVVGYSAIKSVEAGVKKAGSTDSEKLVAAFKGLHVDTPLGPIMFRPQDNQSTMGAYVGRIALKDGKGVLVDATYIDGSKVQPGDAEVKRLRPAN